MYGPWRKLREFLSNKTAFPRTGRLAMSPERSCTCPLCTAVAERFRLIDGVTYFECKQCDFIFADRVLLARVDAGESLRRYDDSYWQDELSAARDRSYGSSLARAAEALLYCSIPVKRFVDIGTGPGYLLDALASFLPSSSDKFYGVEKYPPKEEERSSHPNYLCADLRDVGVKFECGVCIEVLEHLTPKMAENLAKAIAEVSLPGSLFLFNTGLTDYVRNEDSQYLDPYRRGHITCWSVTSAKMVFEKEGFAVHALPGKTWAFVVEWSPPPGAGNCIRDRIWTALEENKAILSDPKTGKVMYLLGLESARAY